jgi:hypothetical protein
VSSPEGAEPGADLAGVGVVQFVEDGQSPPPRNASRVTVADCVMAVAKVDEPYGLVIVVAHFDGQIQSMLVTGEGLIMITKAAVGVGEAVPRECLAGAVTELSIQADGLAARPGCLLAVTKMALAPADRVERLGLSSPVARGQVEV